VLECQEEAAALEVFEAPKERNHGEYCDAVGAHTLCKDGDWLPAAAGTVDDIGECLITLGSGMSEACEQGPHEAPRGYFCFRIDLVNENEHWGVSRRQVHDVGVRCPIADDNVASARGSADFQFHPVSIRLLGPALETNPACAKHEEHCFRDHKLEDTLYETAKKRNVSQRSGDDANEDCNDEQDSEDGHFRQRQERSN